jgi:penicillin-binding protein 1B
MMAGVVNNGTGYSVRARGFTAPAAGKTGTSHDAWFAGYTTNLLCIVWVGYDDYSDLKLSGSATAAPIWAEFMKRAVKLPQSRDAGQFQQPSGVVDVRLDKATNLLSTGACPDAYNIAFISGTEPKMTCDQGDSRNILQRILGIGEKPVPPPAVNGPARIIQPGDRTQQPPSPNAALPAAPSASESDKKRGFFGKVVGIFKGGDDKSGTSEASQPPNRPSRPGSP